MERATERVPIAGAPTRLRWSIPSLDALNVLQTMLVMVSAVQLGRCQGKPVLWVAVATVLPLLRYVGAATYRRRVRAAVRHLWDNVETFATDRARLPYRAAGLLIVLPAGLFFLTQTRPVTSGDTKPILLTATSLVCDGRSDLRAFADLYAALNHYNGPGELPYFLLRTARGIHSAYPSGMVLFALPSAALARLLGADLQRIAVQDRLEKEVASGLAAACLGLFFLLALHLVDARSAALTTLLLAVGSGLCSTVGQALWQHGGVLFWMLLALLVEFRSARQTSRVGSLLQGVALAMTFACRLTSAVLILPFGLWLLGRTPRRALFVGVVAVLAYAPWAWYYQSTYGNPLGPSVGQAPGLSWRGRETLIPLLLSPAHGLFIYQPWILLGLTMCLPQVRRLRTTAEPSDGPAGWRWFCATAIVLHLALIASWNCWWGGHCWGSRLVTETVPLFALLCLRPIDALRRLNWGRSLLVATAVAAGFVNLTGVYLKADYRDVLPGPLSHRLEPPASWQNLPFLTPFLASPSR